MNLSGRDLLWPLPAFRTMPSVLATEPIRAGQLGLEGNRVCKSPIPSLGIKAAGVHPCLSDLQPVP